MNSIHANIRLAINVLDLERLDVDGKKLLVGRVDLQSPVLPSVDIIMVSGIRSGDSRETALPFTCDLLIAARIVDELHVRDQENGDSPMRVYIQRKKKGPWERLSGLVALTEKRGGRVRLSTKIFPVAVASGTVPNRVNDVQL